MDINDSILEELDANIAVVVPKRASTYLEQDLCRLTALIDKLGLAKASHGLLGGEWGYGAEYENNVFMMHPYCWCERLDCPWCGGCNCPPESEHFYVDGIEVPYEEWVRFFEEATNGLKIGTRRYEVAAREANKRRTYKKEPVCDYCLGKGIFAEHGAEPGKGAPNFWYKPKERELKIWWYKWIGRDMEYSRKVNRADWQLIFRHCLDSLIEGAKTENCDQSHLRLP